MYKTGAWVKEYCPLLKATNYSRYVLVNFDKQKAMKFSITFLTLLLLTMDTLGQQNDSSFSNPWSYGVAPIISFSGIFSESESTSVIPGAEIYGNYSFHWGTLHTSVGYNYFSKFSQSTDTSHEINLLATSIGYKGNLNPNGETKFVFRYEPHIILGITESFEGRFSDSFGFPSRNISSELDTRITHGLHTGLEFGHKTQNSFEVGYTYFANPKLSRERGLTLPNRISMRYNFNFATKKNDNKDIYAMKTSLTRLSEDTLYVIDRSCENDFTKAQLDSAFSQHYTFSKFRILETEEIEMVEKQKNVTHLIVIGRHYASYGDPESVGIFLLDKNMKNNVFPYPYTTTHSSSRSRADNCIGNIENASALIKAFNKRLRVKYNDTSGL